MVIVDHSPLLVVVVQHRSVGSHSRTVHLLGVEGGELSTNRKLFVWLVLFSSNQITRWRVRVNDLNVSGLGGGGGGGVGELENLNTQG